MVLRMQNQFVVRSSNIQENAMKTNEYKHFKVKKRKEALSLILASISSIQQPYFQSVHPNIYQQRIKDHNFLMLLSLI